MPAQIRCKEDNMSEVNTFGHGEFLERIAAYLSGGLEGAERSRFEDHRDACAACAAELTRVQEVDRMLAGIFANAQPSGGFEDRIVKELRTTHRSMSLPHPMLLKVASGVAAAILLGAVGFAGNYLIENNKLPGAAKVAQKYEGRGPAAADRYGQDFDSYWVKEEKSGKLNLQTESKTHESAERGSGAEAKDEAPLEKLAKAKRRESEEWRYSNGDGSKGVAEGLNREFDAIKVDAFVEGKPENGAVQRGFGAGGFGAGWAVQAGEKTDAKTGLMSYGVDVSNGQTNLGLDRATVAGQSASGGTLAFNTPVAAGAGGTMALFGDTTLSTSSTATPWTQLGGLPSRGETPLLIGH